MTRDHVIETGRSDRLPGPRGGAGCAVVDDDHLAAAVAEAYAATTRAFSASVVELCGALDADPAPILAATGLDSVAPHPEGATPQLATIARSVGLELPIVEAARRTDTEHLAWIANRIESAVGRSIAGLRVGVWGLTTPSIGADLASSPAVRVADLLVARGAEVAAHDPRLSRAGRHRLPPGVELCSNPLDACVGASVLVVLEAWDGIEEVDLVAAAALLSKPVLFDVGRALDPVARRHAGL
ncbi:MAG: UDP binding domain-containing protein [Acidimicrobiales bacterium]